MRSGMVISFQLKLRYPLPHTPHPLLDRKRPQADGHQAGDQIDQSKVC